jgi:hypothetical protein
VEVERTKSSKVAEEEVNRELMNLSLGIKLLHYCSV